MTPLIPAGAVFVKFGARWGVLVGIVCTLAFLASASSFHLVHAVAPPAPNTPIQGDVDCGGSVDADDALTIVAATAGLKTSECLSAGDVQCDGHIDVIDALTILSFTVGASLPQADNCATIGEGVPLSEQLIADALTAGDIDYETSLIYRAYAIYGDGRLPEEYRSPLVDFHAGTGLFKEVHDHEGTLSGATMEALAPFIARPNDPESIFSQAHTSAGSDIGVWWSKSVAAGRYRVWTNGPEAAAKAMLDAYEPIIDEVVPELAKYVDEPLPDTPGPNLEINLDDAIDIYLIEGISYDPRCTSAAPVGEACYFGIAGQTRDAAPFIGNKSSAWVLMNRRATGDERMHILTHELGHASQNSYDRTEYTDEEWLIDSTAEWGAFRVMKELHRERFAESFLHPFFKQIDYVSLSEGEAVQRYRSWIYYYFLELEKGSHQVVRQIWEAAAADGQQLSGAIDQVFPFEEYFPKFASYNWNQPPYDWYMLDDQIPEVAELNKHQSEDVTLQGSAKSRKFSAPGDVKWLTARYFDFRFTDDGVHSGVFHNGVSDDADAHVTALIKVNGEWREEDWTDENEVYFCRDKSNQKYEELVVIISNSDWKKERPALSPDEEPYLWSSAAGCESWYGSATAEVTFQGALYQMTLKNLLFTPDPQDTDPTDRYATYKLTSAGDLTWQASGDFPGPTCTLSGSMHLDPPEPETDKSSHGFLQTDAETGGYNVQISGYDMDSRQTIVCDGQPSSQLWPVIYAIWDGGVEHDLKDERGKQVAGDTFFDPNPYGGTWKWRFTKIG